VALAVRLEEGVALLERVAEGVMEALAPRELLGLREAVLEVVPVPVLAPAAAGQLPLQAGQSEVGTGNMAVFFSMMPLAEFQPWKMVQPSA
jgi:hypothetical protein